MGRGVALPILIAVLLAAGCRHVPPPAAATPAAPTEQIAKPRAVPADWRARAVEARRRGVEYLVRTQLKGGCWGHFASARPEETWLEDYMAFEAYWAATTSLCCMALQGPSRDDPEAWRALSRGIDYLLTAATPARTSGDVLYDNWGHLYVVYALSVLSRDERLADRRERMVKVALREIGRLAQQQGADGGWGYYDFGFGFRHPTGMETTSFMTAAIMVAFDEARRSGIGVPDALIHDGLIAVERFRLGNGAYQYGNMPLDPMSDFNMVKGSLGRSQPCNLALWRWKRVVTKEDLRRGIVNLFTQHFFIEIGRGRPIPHEAWYHTAGYYYLFGHYYAAKVLEELDPADRATWCPVLAQTLVEGQDPGGSWLDFPMYQFGQPYGTGFALMALEVCLESEEAK